MTSADHRLANRHLALAIDGATGALLLEAAGRRFAGGRLRSAPCSVEVVDGQALRVAYADGGHDVISLEQDLPFVLIRPAFAGGAAGAVIATSEVLRLTLELAGPPMVLGTGGLAAPADAPASYAWMALADPGSRRGVVAGWITHERASGVLACTTRDARVGLCARTEYGRLVLPAGAVVEGEVLAVGWFEDCEDGLEAWADAVARRLGVRLPPPPAVYCTWYADRHGGGGGAASIAALAASAVPLRPFGLSCIQIDDGWQAGAAGNGPRKDFRSHDPDGPYPAGMASTAAAITAQGFTAGLWLLPFGGNQADPAFAADMFVRGADGRPFDTVWGGTCLDMTAPAARERVHTEVARISGGWGYAYVKLDGLYTGAGASMMYVNSGWQDDALGETRFHDPSATHVEALRRGLRLVREAAGPAAFMLGCCAPQNMRCYAGAFGLVDAMRTGPDNNASWRGWASATPFFGAIHHHLHGRIWWNDPDPLYVRAGIPERSARCIASWHGLAGHMVSLSDWLPDLPPARLDLIRRVLPAHRARARALDRFHRRVPRVWHVADDRPDRQRRDVVGLFNWDDDAATVELDLDRLGQPAGTVWALFDWWDEAPLANASGRSSFAVAGRGCRVLALRPLLDRPFLLSTSRHITQGMIEVEAERWDAGEQVLAGISDLIAGDPCELRVHAAGRRFLGAEVDGAPAHARQSEDGLVRLRISPQASGRTAWRLRFAP